MELVIVTNLIQRIQQMLKVSDENSQALSPIIPQTMKYLLALEQIIRQNLREDATVMNNLEKKLNKTQKEIKNEHHNFRKTEELYYGKVTFKDEIILRNCALIIQRQKKHYKLTTKENTIFEQKITSNQRILTNHTKQMNNEIITALARELEHNRIRNMLKEDDERKEWNKWKEKLSHVLLEYDVKMFNQLQELELINETLKNDEGKLLYFKNAYTTQTEVYEALMAEKEQYLEQQRQNKLAEIRMKIARRTIAKFIEKHYAAWKKKKLRASKKKAKYRYNLNMSKIK